MDFLLNKIVEWIKNILIGGIMDNLNGLFDGINGQVADIAGTVGATPQSWNSSVFNMIKGLSDNVIIPVAGVVLTAVMCYELIQMVIDRNSLHDFETFVFFKWVVKAAVSVLIISHTWDIIMGIFDVAQRVVNGAAGSIISNADLDSSSVVNGMEAGLRYHHSPPHSCGFLCLQKAGGGLRQLHLHRRLLFLHASQNSCRDTDILHPCMHRFPN